MSGTDEPPMELPDKVARRRPLSRSVQTVARALLRNGLCLVLIAVALWWFVGSILRGSDNMIVFVNESEEDFGTVQCQIRRDNGTILQSDSFPFHGSWVHVLTYPRAFERDPTLFLTSDGKTLVYRTMVPHGRYGQTIVVSFDDKNQWRLGSRRIGWGDGYARQRDRERGLTPIAQ